MAQIGVDNFFTPMTFEQANPQFANSDSVNKMYNNIIQAQYAQPNAQANLQKQLLANQIAQAQAQYAPQSELAKLQQLQALPGLTRAQTAEEGSAAGLNSANSALIRGRTPYEVQLAKLNSTPDPIIQRLAQIEAAKQNNPALYKSLQQFGLASSDNGQSSSMNNGQNSMPQSMPNMTNMQNMHNANMNAVTAPKFSAQGSDPYNYAMFGSPYNPFMAAQLKSQAEAQGKGDVEQYNSAQKDAQDESQSSNNLENLSNQFIKNYNKSKLVGPQLGSIPITGIAGSSIANLTKKSLGANSDLTPEQLTDNASQNMAAAVAKMIAGGRVTNYEMQYVQNLKPGRYMTPQAAQMTANFLKEKAIRMQEKPAFLNAARAEGIPVQTAGTLWNQYNIQRPVYDFQNNKPNTQFQNSWKDYLNPNVLAAHQATRSILQNQNVPRGTSNDFVSIMTPSGKRMKIPSSSLNQALSKGARRI